MAVQPDKGHRAGFVIHWFGVEKFGNAEDAKPYVEVESQLYKRVLEGCYGFLSMQTYGVNWDHNKVSINGKEIGYLHKTTSYEWRVDTFVVGTDVIVDGINTFRIDSGTQSGDPAGPDDDIDDFEVKDPVLIFAVPDHH